MTPGSVLGSAPGDRQLVQQRFQSGGGAAALARDETARAAFDGLSFTHRKERVRWVEEAKKAETRAGRIAKTVQSLRDGKRSR